MLLYQIVFQVDLYILKLFLVSHFLSYLVIGFASPIFNNINNYYIFQLWCVVSNIFGSEINVLNLSQPTESDQNELKLRFATNRLSQTVIQDSASSISTDSESSMDQELTVLSW